MMADYKQLNSILNLNGKNLAVDLFTWGNLTLTGSDLTQFQSDITAFSNDIQPYLTAGNIVLGVINETVTTQDGSNLTIVVGQTNTRSPDFPPDSRIQYWSQRMAADPNVLRYNPEVRIS
jgi:hypothetical protein